MNCSDCLFHTNNSCVSWGVKKSDNNNACYRYIDKKILNSKIIPYGDKLLKKVKTSDQDDCEGCFFLKFDSCVSPKGYPCEYAGKCWKYEEVTNEQEKETER